MSMNYKCDVCGTDTWINPPIEQLFETKEAEVDTPEMCKEEVEVEVTTSTGKKEKKLITRDVVKIVKKKQIARVPKMTIMKRQNSQTGIIEDIPIQDIKYLKPKAYMVRLMIGDEYVQRDFCKGCLDKEIINVVKPLWGKLSEIVSQ